MKNIIVHFDVKNDKTSVIPRQLFAKVKDYKILYGSCHVPILEIQQLNNCVSNINLNNVLYYSIEEENQID